MSKRLVILLFAFLTLGMQAFAQNAVSGTIVDANGEPIIGASVLIKGTSVGTVTDLDGAWTLNVKDQKATLVFSCIGFTSQELSADAKNLKIVLQEDAAFLDEVVVVGYGTTRKKDVSGAIQSVNYGTNKTLADLPNPNVYSSLSSKVAGLQYAPTTSASGDNSNTMTIRGKNAIPEGTSSSEQSINKPLIVVDGVLSFDSINSINTNDIESIDVLKDASAAAIYGSRAANGVIIITTKRGSSEKPKVGFNASVSFSDWANMPKMVSDETTFMKNRFLAKVAAGQLPEDSKWTGTYDVAQLLTATELQAYNQGVYTNWLDEISRVGIGQKYDLNVSGRSKRVSYYISGNYTKQQGIRVGDDYQKYTVLSKVDVNVTDWLTIGLKLNYLSGKSDGQPAAIQNAIWMSPYSFTTSTVKGYENWYNSHPDGNTVSPFIGSNTDSYLYTDNVSKNGNLNGVAYVKIDFPFLKGLSYQFTAQGQRNDSSNDKFTHPESWVRTDNVSQMDDPSQFNIKAGGSSSTTMSSYWNLDNILTYSREFGDHHVDAMAGYTSEHSNSEGLGTSFTGFTVPTTLGVYVQDKVVYDSDKGTTYTIKRTRTESSAIGILARLNYNYKSRYYISGNFRRDGYSAFASDHKWGNFWGVSAAWVLSNEEFIKSAGWIDFLKVRLSWGQNGSRSVSPYITAATVSNVTANSGAQTNAWLGGKSALGITATNLANSQLTWATVEKANLGFDFSFLSSRLNGTLDLYLGRTTDMLMPRSVPYISGFSSTYDNVGLVTNNGIELTLNSVNINGNGDDTFRWETNLVFDTNSNKVVSLYGPDATGKEADDVANYLVTPEANYALMVGRPISAAYGMRKISIFNSEQEIKDYVNDKGEMLMPNAKPGDIKFADVNGDGKVDANDREYLGSGDPLFTINLGNTLRWKNFSLFFNFRWAQGDKTHFLGLDPNSYGIGTSGAQLAKVTPWTEENHNQTYPRYGYGNPYSYQYWTPRSFLKLKDLSFSYNVPEKVFKNAFISGLRVYIAATDLFTITNWTGIDPESGGTIANGASSSRYISDGTYKSTTIGVNLTF